MSNEPIDLTAYRNAREEPDADCIAYDEYGRKLYTFILSFEMEGKSYGAEIKAYDEEEANKKIAAMRETLEYSGKLFSVIEV